MGYNSGMRVRLGCKQFYHNASKYLRLLRMGEVKTITLLVNGIEYAEIKPSRPKRKKKGRSK